MKTELFICRCHNVEHQLVFFYDDEEVFVTTHLIPERNIFKRIWYAIKYIFGHTSKYGHFDEFVFNKKDVDKLQKIVDFLKM